MVKDTNKLDKTEESLEAIRGLHDFLIQESGLHREAHDRHRNMTDYIIEEVRNIQSGLSNNKVSVYFWLGFFMAMTLSLSAILCLNLV